MLELEWNRRLEEGFWPERRRNEGVHVVNCLSSVEAIKQFVEFT